MYELKIFFVPQSSFKPSYKYDLQHVLYKYYQKEAVRYLTFSDIQGAFYDKKSGLLNSSFGNFIVRSSQEDFIDAVASGLAKDKTFYAAGSNFKVYSIEKRSIMSDSNECWLKAISPVCAYRKPNGMFIYFNPYEDEFIKILLDNIDKKAKYFGMSYNIDRFEILPGAKKVIVKYKQGKITTWLLKIHIKASPEVINIILGTGLGKMNRCGLGCMEEIE